DLYLSDVPVLTDGAEEPYRIRPAQVDDIPALMALYERQCTGKLVTNVLSEARWRYDLTQHSDGSDIRMHVMTLVDGTDVVIGYYKTWWDAWGSFRLQEFGLAAGHPYRVAGPTVMRYVANLRGGYEEEFTDEQPNRIRFSLGAEHSLYAAYDRTLTPLVNAGAWYLRVPDLPGLLRHVAPVLERRLAQSALSGYTGTLYLNGYVDGLELTFTRGMLAGVTPVDPRERDGQWFASSGDAHFPPGVFLKLLFGYRSLAELCYAYPDCRASDAAAALLEVLFPKQPSWVTFVG
ncbi:MAG: hypothetical protein JW910_23225, partial [Anaerolineae bacterium]|nr:hypothetical protein [Anaerolineae bacterium]